MSDKLPSERYVPIASFPEFVNIHPLLLDSAGDGTAVPQVVLPDPQKKEIEDFLLQAFVALLAQQFGQGFVFLLMKDLRLDIAGRMADDHAPVGGDEDVFDDFVAQKR